MGGFLPQFLHVLHQRVVLAFRGPPQLHTHRAYPKDGDLVANFTFNIAKGRVGEYYQRVDSNDPANSALIVVVLATSGLEFDSTLIDYDNLSLLLAGASNEVTNVNYARKTLTDADLGAATPDDTNDRFDYDIPDQTWTSVAAGDG